MLILEIKRQLEFVLIATANIKDSIVKIVQLIKKLISLELFNEWIQRRIPNIQDVQKKAQECKSVLDSLINIFIPYFNIMIEQLGISQIGDMIKGLCQIKVCQYQLFNQLKQSIQQVKQIIDEILKKFKSQTDYQCRINQEFQKPLIKKPLVKEQKKQPLNLDLIKQYAIK
ncbi:unnamed protein product [Paramecium sonneborni]|uniref:Uncharacterized protein n=1 Tax=Paramecium sonneborni TaxID=65129 RepID=A0A8S1RP37_9CILI|nr:unnamed protein product [Paramecium sonneborni]